MRDSLATICKFHANRRFLSPIFLHELCWKVTGLHFQALWIGFSVLFGGDYCVWRFGRRVKSYLPQHQFQKRLNLKKYRPWETWKKWTLLKINRIFILRNYWLNPGELSIRSKRFTIPSERIRHLTTSKFRKSHNIQINRKNEIWTLLKSLLTAYFISYQLNLFSYSNRLMHFNTQVKMIRHWTT